MKLKFKNRIAIFNTLAAAGSTLLAFAAVYAVVFLTVYKQLDDEIRGEKTDVFKSIQIIGSDFALKNGPEWDEKEHTQVEVSPIFLQISDKNDRIVYHSANLKSEHLSLEHRGIRERFSDASINQNRIRLGQFPIINDEGQQIGHLCVGVSQVESSMVLDNLLKTLALAFPILVLIFFFASSFAAERAISPVHQLIETASGMDEQQLSTRLPLPAHRDEIYLLAQTINELLQRLEHSFQREKQVTADISHELRTPLTGIRGTLEVLLRKERTPEQYEQKIEQVLAETDRLHVMLEQLLQLSRLEAGSVPVKLQSIPLQSYLSQVTEKWRPLLADKQLALNINLPQQTEISADPGLLELILDNLMSNALKYGAEGASFDVFWKEAEQTLAFQDHGPGIPEAQLPYVFDRFYRGDDSRNARIQGTGLGLSIAKKLAMLQGISLSVQSQMGQGTYFLLDFKKTQR